MVCSGRCHVNIFCNLPASNKRQKINMFTFNNQGNSPPDCLTWQRRHRDFEPWSKADPNYCSSPCLVSTTYLRHCKICSRYCGERKAWSWGDQSCSSSGIYGTRYCVCHPEWQSTSWPNCRPSQTARQQTSSIMAATKADPRIYCLINNHHHNARMAKNSGTRDVLPNCADIGDNPPISSVSVPVHPA